MRTKSSLLRANHASIVLSALPPWIKQTGSPARSSRCRAFEGFGNHDGYGLVEYCRSGDDFAGEIFLDDLGRAQEEDVIGSVAHGIEGGWAVILVKFETAVRRQHGGPNSPAYIEQQAPRDVVRSDIDKTWTRNGAASDDPCDLMRSSTGPAQLPDETVAQE